MDILSYGLIMILKHGLHANFKLSSTGEEAILSNPQKTIIDKVTFPEPTLELSYSRVPNGTGEFQVGESYF